jgi:hypothetical protein
VIGKLRIYDVDVKLYGDTAVVHYKSQVRIVFNEEPAVKTFNSTEVLVQRDGRWQSVMHTETVIPGEVAGIKINPKVYDDYVREVPSRSWPKSSPPPTQR